METRYTILSFRLDFRGHLPTFIDRFLSHRLFQLRAGSTLSDTYEQEMGVPQGSILSPVLFSLKIGDIVKSVLNSSEVSLLAYDFDLCICVKSLPHAKRLMHLSVNSVYVIMVAFYFAREDFGGMFDHLSPACVFFFFFCVEISRAH